MILNINNNIINQSSTYDKNYSITNDKYQSQVGKLVNRQSEGLAPSLYISEEITITNLKYKLSQNSDANKFNLVLFWEVPKVPVRGFNIKYKIFDFN